MEKLLKNKKLLGVIIAVLVLAVAGIAGSGSEDTDTPTTTENTVIESVLGNDASEEISNNPNNDSENNTEKQIENSTEKAPEAHKPVGNGGGSVSLDNIPAFSGSPYVAINGNTPSFSASEITTKSYESYSSLDGLGRCSVVIACLGRDIMPTGDRGSIGQVKPSGWQTVKYDFVDGKYLYNRCHLIGFQLSGENANTRNLITGTRYMNVQGMLPFENMVADYIKETNNHVMYRVTPVFKGNELVARGVQIEAYSVEDEGDGICFNVYCYNVQPGVEIDYQTGKSSLATDTTKAPEATKKPETTVQATTEQTTSQATQAPDIVVTTRDFVLNTNSKKYHTPSCRYANEISPQNRQEYNGTTGELEGWGYVPCKVCH